jgi:hypothetical protein
VPEKARKFKKVTNSQDRLSLGMTPDWIEVCLDTYNGVKAYA